MPTPLYAASPSRLLAYLECPRRYRFQYLDRPRPTSRPQRAHTSVGLATHNALRDWWDLPRGERTASGGAALLRKAWIETGFRDDDQSGRWRSRVGGEVKAYLGDVDPDDQPRGIERTVAMRTDSLVLNGRVDRIDERPGVDGPELVIVDYKTSRRTCTEEDARTSLPLALYAAAAGRMFRRRTLRVELHHVPTGTVVGPHAYRGVVAPQARRGRLPGARRSEGRRVLPRARRRVVVVPTPAVGAVHLVRLPCCLSGGTADGAGEVLVGSPRAG